MNKMTFRCPGWVNERPPESMSVLPTRFGMSDTLGKKFYALSGNNYAT